MELIIEEVKLPEKIDFNYEELKQELTEKVSHYETLVYTDDQIKEAKADKASLNKLKKALNDERIRREKEYMQPFDDFKSKINEIISIIDKPVQMIDKQVKEYGEKLQNEKMENIEKLFDSIGFQSFVTLDAIFDPKWLNASTSLKTIEEAMKSIMYGISNDVMTINELPSFSFEAMESYKRTLDLAGAIREGKRLEEIAKAKAEHEAEQARLKAEAEARKAEEEAKKAAESEMANQTTPPVEEPKEFISPVVDNSPFEEVNPTWVKFQALMTVEQAKELKQFFDDREIEFKPL